MDVGPGPQFLPGFCPKAILSSLPYASPWPVHNIATCFIKVSKEGSLIEKTEVTILYNMIMK